MCSLHLTHPSAHTFGAVGSRHCSTRGAVGGSVTCSRVSLQSWTIPAGVKIIFFYTAEKQYNLQNNRQIFYNLQKNLTKNIRLSCLITLIIEKGSMFCPQTKTLAMSLGLGEISSGDTSSPPFLDLKYKYCIRIIPVDVMGFKSLKNNPTMLDKHTIWHLSLEQAGGCAWNYSFWVFSQSPKLRNIMCYFCSVCEQDPACFSLFFCLSVFN